MNREYVWIAAELAFNHYNPDTIKKGTLFMNVRYPGTDKEFVDIYCIDQLQSELIDKGIFEIPPEMGMPVQPVILDDDSKVIATPDEIAWFDPGHADDKLWEFTVKEMNIIMQDFDGLCEILVDEGELANNFIQPHYESDRVILRGLSPDEDDESDTSQN
jgi:hypothetical protein|tara:strand:+ start:1361 stop:1840 length:480 start_codon:yes stop_codon:yes gene_type:complete